MIRKLALGFFALVLLLLVAAILYIIYFNNQIFQDSPNRLSYKKDTCEIHFQWAKQQFGGHLESHTAMVIPATIAGTKYKAFFQLDSGTPHSYIYGKTLSSLRDIDIAMGRDTLSGTILQDLDITLGGNEITFRQVSIMSNYGKEVVRDDTIKSIMLGTIGADFLDDRITAIDFKLQTIQLYDHRPPWMNDIKSFKDFEFKGRRFLLPVQINDQDMTLLYDSGCSAFGLITSKNRYLKYGASDLKEISYQGNRWGEALPIYHKPSESILRIGGSELSLERVSYVDMFGNFQRFVTPFTSIGGFLGNMPFLDHVLILDTQSMQYAVVESL